MSGVTGHAGDETSNVVSMAQEKLSDIQRDAIGSRVLPLHLSKS
jgi:hypothetical protein